MKYLRIYVFVCMICPLANYKAPPPPPPIPAKVVEIWPEQCGNYF